MNRYEDRTDEQLIKLCAGGNDDSFQEIMRRYLKRIYNFTRQYINKNHDIEDIVQETFFKVWKSSKKFKNQYSLKSWIYTIARNTALDHIKKKRDVPFSEFDDIQNDGSSLYENAEDQSPIASEVFDDLIMSQNVDKILESLHPDYRSVLTLHYYENMTFQEIAIIMNRPMNTVKSWHRRALENIRVQIAPKSHRQS